MAYSQSQSAWLTDDLNCNLNQQGEGGCRQESNEKARALATFRPGQPNEAHLPTCLDRVPEQALPRNLPPGDDLSLRSD